MVLLLPVLVRHLGSSASQEDTDAGAGEAVCMRRDRYVSGRCWQTTVATLDDSLRPSITPRIASLAPFSRASPIHLSPCSQSVFSCSPFVTGYNPPPPYYRSATITTEYVCITTYQLDTKYNPNSTSKQYAIVSIQLNIVTCPTYADKFIRDMLLHRLYHFRL